MSPPIEPTEAKMASAAMAQAVLEHAQAFYDDGWYVVAECWDLWAVEEELDRQEQLTGAPFHLEAGAIAHFAKWVPRPGPH
jgi:hypothetical protein